MNFDNLLQKEMIKLSIADQVSSKASSPANLNNSPNRFKFHACNLEGNLNLNQHDKKIHSISNDSVEESVHTMMGIRLDF